MLVFLSACSLFNSLHSITSIQPQQEFILGKNEHRNFKVHAKNLSNYQLHQWNYRWTSAYGSAHYSLKDPEQKNEDPVAVQSANLSADRQSIFLSIPEITAVNTLRIRLNVKAADGNKVGNAVYLTINKVPR